MNRVSSRATMATVATVMQAEERSSPRRRGDGGDGGPRYSNHRRHRRDRHGCDPTAFLGLGKQGKWLAIYDKLTDRTGCGSVSFACWGSIPKPL